MFTADLFERAIKTFLQAALVAFLMLMGASMTKGIEFSLAWWQAAATAALGAAFAAGASAVTSLFSKGVGSKNSASLIKPTDHVDITTMTGELVTAEAATLELPDGYSLVHNSALAPAVAASPVAAPPAAQPTAMGTQDMRPVDPSTIPGYALPVQPVVATGAPHETAPVVSADQPQQ